MSCPGVLVYFSNSTLLEGLLSHHFYRNSLHLWHGQESHQNTWENMVPPKRTCYANPADTLCPKTAALQAWLQQQHLPKLYCQGSLEEFSAGRGWVLGFVWFYFHPLHGHTLLTGHIWLAGKKQGHRKTVYFQKKKQESFRSEKTASKKSNRNQG